MKPETDRLAVAVNLLWLVPGVVGGSEEYLVRSLLALAEHHPGDLDVTLYGARELGEAHPALAAAFDIVSPERSPTSKVARVVAESTWLARRTARADVVHHAGGLLPVRCSGRTVLTLHDTQPLDLPENFSLFKRHYLGRQLPRSLHRADLVIGSSRFVLATAVAAGAKVAAVQHVPPCLIDSTSQSPTGHEAAAVLARLGVSRPYVMYPAITYPHKNHRLLVAALAQTEGVDLVLTGGVAQEEQALAEAIAAGGLGDRVHRLGRVPHDDFAIVMANALAMVFPSRYEGFGLPVLEAMASGVPVLAANATALPEVLGPAGWLLSPDEPDVWAAAVARLQAEPATVATLSAAGRARARQFTARRTAHALAIAYRRAAGRKG